MTSLLQITLLNAILAPGEIGRFAFLGRQCSSCEGIHERAANPLMVSNVERSVFGFATGGYVHFAGARNPRATAMIPASRGSRDGTKDHPADRREDTERARPTTLLNTIIRRVNRNA